MTIEHTVNLTIKLNNNSIVLFFYSYFMFMFKTILLLPNAMPYLKYNALFVGKQYI